MTTPTPQRVMLVEDHPLFRDGLAATLSLDAHFDVVAQAATADEALTAARTTDIDLVIMDLGLPGRSGIDATRELKHEHPHVKVLVITMSEDDDNLLAAMRAGARGYLLKGASRDEILRALHTIADGGGVFSPHMAERLGCLLAAYTTAAAKDAFPTLTPREREILHHLATGLTYQQIADRLYLSDKTVRNHVGSIFTKLQVRNRAEAIIRARQAGLGT